MDGKEKKVKATHTFPPALLARLERLAEREQRPVSRQLAILLEDALNRVEKQRQAA